MNKQKMENGANRARFSGENLLNHPPMNVGQPALDAIVIKIQALVIETQQVQNGGVKIVPAHRVDSGAVACLLYTSPSPRD